MINQELRLGNIRLEKEVEGNFGSGDEGLQKALKAASENEGSELVYEKNGSWHVSKVVDDTMDGKISPLRKSDSITLNMQELLKQGINPISAAISFKEDDK